MFSSRRSFGVVAAQLFSAVLLTSASPVWADIVTYTIADYPESQIAVSPYTGDVDVSGTITVDTGATPISNTGITISIDEITAANFSVQTAAGTISGTADLYYSVGFCQGLMATATKLYLEGNQGNGSWFRLRDQDPAIGIDWTEFSEYGGGATDYYTMYGPTLTSIFDDEFSTNSGTQMGAASVPGVAIGGSPMIIATAVPEPGTFTLLISGLLGLVGAFYLRRRAKA